MLLFILFFNIFNKKIKKNKKWNDSYKKEEQELANILNTDFHPFNC